MSFRRLLVVSMVGGLLLMGGAGGPQAHEMMSGPGFGTHVSEMAPDHPRADGAEFGACVSAMARGESCLPH